MNQTANPRIILHSKIRLGEGNHTINPCDAVGAASQWCSNKRMIVYFKVKMERCSLMMVKYSVMMVKWLYDHTFISPSFAYLTIIEKLHRLLCQLIDLTNNVQNPGCTAGHWAQVWVSSYSSWKRQGYWGWWKGNFYIKIYYSILFFIINNYH